MSLNPFRVPPKRTIKFRIDLILGAQLVSCSPIRMLTKENEELRKKLTELVAE